MDLSTSYLGLRLPHPFLVGASPLADDLDTLKRLEDAGAAAVVLRSLFEEQIAIEQYREIQDVEAAEDTVPEAVTYLPRRDEYRILGPDRYLEHLRKAKEAVGIPLIASLNGVTTGGWLDYARMCQEAGADALELNVYLLAADPDWTGTAVENRVVSLVAAIAGAVSLPLAVKLSPFFSSLPNLVRHIEEAGARGVVLFNRFYQPDIDIEALEARPRLSLSDPSELLLRLRWLAILFGRVGLDLAVTGGVHGVADAVKAAMAGATAIQMVSALLKGGPDHLTSVRRGFEDWLESHEYASLDQMRGSMSLARSPDPAAFERGNYVKILQGGEKRV